MFSVRPDHVHLLHVPLVDIAPGRTRAAPLRRAPLPFAYVRRLPRPAGPLLALAEAAAQAHDPSSLSPGDALTALVDDLLPLFRRLLLRACHSIEPVSAETSRDFVASGVLLGALGLLVVPHTRLHRP